jgi:CubicO group peptidase (beta-lactamase class C family)
MSKGMGKTNSTESNFDLATEILRKGIQRHAFPGAVAAVWHPREPWEMHVGQFTYDDSAPAITADTVFDLASVSKVVATTAMAMILYERGQLDLETPVVNVVPEFCGDDARRERVTMRMLLAHSSGLPAYEKLFERAHTPDELLAACFCARLEREPGTATDYSDLGFIVLGVALERFAGETLDGFCAREVFSRLGMHDTCFCPPADWKPRIAPAADDRAFRKRVIQGEVQDENAWVLGGVAGHAGVFSTARDVTKFAACMLSGGAPIVRPETVKLFTARQPAQPGSSRALGWDTPTSPSQSGKYFSSHSFGHLGYTGTSVWIDPDRQLAVTLLTNRTWPDCSSQEIKQVRPRFHDAVVEALGGSEK